MDFQALLKNLPFAKKEEQGVVIPGADGTAVTVDPNDMNIVDLIAPQYLEMDWNYMKINNKYYSVLMITDYPRTVRSTWLSPLINFESSLAISTFYYPVDSDEILDKLKKKIAELEASLATEYEKGKVLDPKNKVALQDAQSLLDNVASGKEKFFNTGMYIRVSAASPKELDSLIKNVQNTLRAIGLNAVPLTLRVDEGITSTLPYALDPIYKVRNMDTTALAMTFPFVTSDLTMSQGILYGVNMHNNSMVIFDRFEMPNLNEVIFATSGAGKSYLVKLEAMRYLLTGCQVLIIDPESEYEKLSRAVDGEYITFSQDTGSKINPFEFLKSSKGGTKNILNDKIQGLHTLMKLMLGELSNVESSLLDRAFRMTYNEKGINNDPDTWTNPAPLLEDLYKVLKGMAEKESHELAARLEKFVFGSAAGVFNQPTNIEITNKFTVFSIRDLQDDLRPIAMYMILDFIWTRVREDLRKRILIVDEAWTMMQYEDSARFLYGIAKRGRKYYLGLTTISQDVDEFLASRYGKAVVTNSSLQFLLKQSPAAIDLITNTFNLSSGERNFLLSAGVGEGIFFAGRNHVAIKIIASRGEHRLITSNPKELSKMKEQNLQFSEEDIAESALIYEPGTE
ncbi:MAG: ATP-binding protein [Candidatus Dojkabacteria bacterium]|nr:MAG: ATP-binding protein [Candidatus Dojkabacteria bacterium]